MKKLFSTLLLLMFHQSLAEETAVPDKTQFCANQAREIMMRTYTDVLPEMTADQRSRLMLISRDICMKHMARPLPLQTAGKTTEQTAATEPENKHEEKDGNWLKAILNSESPDKEGNKRLKRRMK